MNESHNSRDIQHLPSSRQGMDAREWGGVADTPRLTEGEREREPHSKIRTLVIELWSVILPFTSTVHRSYT